MGPQVDCEDHSCTKFCFVTKTLGEVSGVALCVLKLKFAKQTLLLLNFVLEKFLWRALPALVGNNRAHIGGSDVS